MGFISHESDVESSKATDVLETSAEEEALGSDDAEITPDNKKKIYRGMLFVLIGGASWGAFGTAAKYLLDTYHVDPMWLIDIRELCACWLFLGTAFAFDRKISQLSSGSQKSWQKYLWLACLPFFSRKLLIFMQLMLLILELQQSCSRWACWAF